MSASDILREEHSAVLAVLDQLGRAVNAIVQGAPVPPSVLADLAEFFAVFVDRCHHAKEESAVFPRLGSAGAATVLRLEADHTTGRKLAADFAEAAADWTPGNITAASRLQAAARTYAALLRAHIERESAELLPLMEMRFDDAADAEIVAAFERIETEQIGAGTHERLHALIDSLGPRIAAAVR
ncbi:MAG TPA: hemerythrin domain-containing protein [Dehalococcoidia bacterium]|nr:hemerythrin domain-containing protein [Dehalococcoidia bacterium]